jgi:hypothetical protein
LITSNGNGNSPLTQLRPRDRDHLAWISKGAIPAKRHAHERTLSHEAVLLQPLREYVMLIGHIEYHRGAHPPASEHDERRRCLRILGDNGTKVDCSPAIATEEKSPHLPARFRGAGESARAIEEALEKFIAAGPKGCFVQCNDCGPVAIF